MLLQTNSYIVPRDKRMEHARLLRRFRQVLLRLGCDHFEVFEQVGANWSTSDSTGRFVQIMHFRDRKHQLAIQAAERGDPTAQVLLKEFCDLINLPYQQQQGLFAVGFYTSFLRMPQRSESAGARGQAAPEPPSQDETIGQPDAAAPPESMGMSGIAEQAAGTTEPGELDLGAEGDDPAAGDADPLDSQSVFLPPDNNDGPEDSSDPAESSPPHDESSGAENPSPSSS